VPNPITVAIDARTATGAFTGIGRYTVSLVSALVEVAPDLDIRLLTAEGAQTHFADLVGPRLSLHSTRMIVPRHPWSDLWLHLCLPRFLSRSRSSILFSTANYLPLFSGGARRVVTIHDLVPFRFPSADPWTFVVYLKTMLRQASRCADRIVSVSHSTARELVEILGIPEDRIVVVHNGVLPRFRPLSASELENRRVPVPEAPFILSVGARIPRKNFARLIRAVARLRKRGYPHHLVLAGPPGSSQPELEATVEATGLSGAVHFVGYPDDDDLVWLYNKAQMFVYPSIYEGFGIPVLEAMACGTPVVCSSGSSLPEVSGEAALMFDPFSVEQIAELVERVLQDPEMAAEMKSRGLARAALFTWEAAARKTADIFRSLSE